MKHVIYCFSGTGNGLYIAREIAKKLKDTEILPLLSLRKEPNVPACYQRVGFVLPTCFGHPPKAVTETAESLIFQPNQKVFIIVTCGGGNILTLSDFRKQLQPKTPHPVQCFEIKLPGNHIVGFSAWKDSVQQKMFLKADEKIEAAARQILEGTPTKIHRDINKRLATFLSETFNGRLGVKDIHTTHLEYYTTDACVRCGICERLCPVSNIKIAETEVQFGSNCQQCMACIQWCPRRAIAHPNVPADRRRYHHPAISLQDMLKLNEGGK